MKIMYKIYTCNNLNFKLDRPTNMTICKQFFKTFNIYKKNILL